MPAIIPFIPLIAGAITGGAAVTGAVMQNRANNNASSRQLDASKHADDLAAGSEDKALQFQREQMDYDRWRDNAQGAARQPYLDALAGLIGDGSGGGGFSPSGYTPETFEQGQPFESTPFTAPDPSKVGSDAGFQFRLKEGQGALERSAASRGTLLTGGTLKDALAYGQEMGSQEYDKQYGRSRSEYDLDYSRKFGEYSMNEANRAGAFDRNQSAGFNAAQLQQQGAYQSASLSQSSLQSRIQALLSMAGLAQPGQYPGSTGGAAPPRMPQQLNQFGVPTQPAPWSPGQYGGGGNAPTSQYSLDDRLGSDPSRLPSGPSYMDDVFDTRNWR